MTLVLTATKTASEGRGGPLSYLREARPAVQGIFLLRYLAAGAVAHLGSHHRWFQVGAGGAVWFLATMAVYLVNGATDVVEDRLNNSNRPVARGEITVGRCVTVSVVLAVVALLAGFALGRLWQLVLVMVVLGWLYSAPPFALKRTAAGAAGVVIVAGAVTYLAGWEEGAGGSVNADLILLMVGMSLWMGLVGANAKDLSDVDGDAAAGRRTGAVVWGERRARFVVAAAALVVGVGFLLVAWRYAPTLRWTGVVMAVGGCVLAWLATSRLSDGDRARRRLPYRVFMVTQYLGHLTLLMPLVVDALTGLLQ